MLSSTLTGAILGVADWVWTAAVEVVRKDVSDVFRTDRFDIAWHEANITALMNAVVTNVAAFVLARHVPLALVLNLN